MTEAFAHNLDRCARGGEQAGAGVSKVRKRTRGIPLRARCRSNSWLFDSAYTGRPDIKHRIRPAGEAAGGTAQGFGCDVRAGRWCERFESTAVGLEE
jgi:hypothetical protein